MSRIKCKTPSTGKVINYVLSGISTAWTTLAYANDFSVPDASNVFPHRDNLDDSRAIRPGEIFFLTPLFVRNTSNTDCYIEVMFASDEDVDVMCPGRMLIPAQDTALVPIQGRSLLKRRWTNTALAASLIGDKLLVKAESAGVLDVWASAEEKLSSEHIGVE